MGIYFTTNICFGFRIPIAKITELNNTKEINEKWITKDIQGATISVPHTVVELKSAEHFISQDKISINSIYLNELDAKYNLSTEKFKINDEEREILNSIMKKYEIDEQELNTWINGYMFNTYDFQTQLMYQLLVKS